MAELPGLAWLAAAIEFAGALVIAGHCAAAVWAIGRGRGPAAARLLVIAGALSGLSLKTAATLLRTITLHDWNAIGAFVAVFTLRTVVKQVMGWEQRRLDAAAARAA